MEAEVGRRSSTTAVKSEDGGTSDDIRRGPWTVEEDFNLINYIATHGEGRWNSLARCSGLKRTGKSCRLRWLNYLRPDVRRGNITLEEQLLILELHSRWGNRWSKIAQYLPGRTDNEIKNYWRTRVQKHAKQLKCDVNSKQFKDAMRYLWMPRLVERIQAAAANSTSTTATTSASAAATTSTRQFADDVSGATAQIAIVQPQVEVTQVSTVTTAHGYTYTPESSNTAASSDSFTVHQVSPVSDMADYYHVPMMNNFDMDRRLELAAGEQMVVGASGFYNGGSSSQYFGLDMDQQTNSSWFGGEVVGEQSLWNADDFWFLQQQLNNL